jgi:hypothetical protein
MLSSVGEVIEALGGTGATAVVARVGSPAVSNWLKRGKISQERFFLIREALEARGLDVSPVVFGFKVDDEVRA